MWSMTQDGFFSAVKHRDKPDIILVRTRARRDAEFLRDWLLREHKIETVIVGQAKSDYAWRLEVPVEAYGSFMVAQVEEIDYDNFKNRVHDKNEVRARVYMTVWTALLRVEQEDHPTQQTVWPPLASSAGLFTYGGGGYPLSEERDLLDEDEGSLARSIHDLTDAEWQELEAAAERDRLSRARKPRKARNRQSRRR